MPSLILVTGGTGTLGTHVVHRLNERGYPVRVLSRKARSGTKGVEYVVGDLAKGTGVDDAVAGADVIVHCASSTRADAEATQNLVNAAKAQKPPPHLVYISIVGVSGIRFGYFQTKLAAEKIVTDSGLPWTLRRCQELDEVPDHPCAQGFPGPADRPNRSRQQTGRPRSRSPVGTGA